MRHVLVAALFACGRPSQPAGPPPTPIVAAPDGGASSATGCVGDPPGPGYECVRDCGEPVAKEGDPEPGWSWLSPEQAANRKQYGCPICLPADARIATPSGEVPIASLSEGMLVWSPSTDGGVQTRRVALVASTPVPSGHELAVIDLEDGRTLRASPGHPGADGRPIGEVAVGGLLDGSRVVRVTRLPYAGRTFDLVLEGGASEYIADGVRLRSSLGRP